MNNKYFWSYFASGIYFLAFTFNILASLIIGFAWPILILTPMIGLLAALCISSFRKGCFYHNEHLRSLCQRQEENSKKILLG